MKPLTHAFTSRRRISSGLENLVTRLSHSDPRGPDHQGCSDSLSSKLDSQWSLFPTKRRVGLRAFFFFLEDLTPFPSCSYLVEGSKLPPSGCIHDAQDAKACSVLSGVVNLKSASLSRGNFLGIVSPPVAPSWVDHETCLHIPPVFYIPSETAMALFLVPSISTIFCCC